MRKTFKFFIVPAVITLLFFSIYIVYFIYSQKSPQTGAEINHFLIFICLMSVVAILQIAYFNWKYMYKTGAELQKVTEVAQRLKEGTFAQRFSYEDANTPELQSLRKSLNNLVGKVEKRVVNLQLQINEKAAVLSSMSEAVIAVNSSEKVYIFNRAAQKMFATTFTGDEGATLSSLIRLSEVYKVLSENIDEMKNLDDNLYIKDAFIGNEVKELHLNVKSSPIYDRKEQITGKVFVIKDTTKIRKLEKHRTNFVGNVSHELKTPLTLIQGFAETLLTNDELSAENYKKYIGIIHKHSSRLGTLINDLLAISKLESEKNSELELESGDVSLVVKSAISLCQERAKEREVQLNFVQHGDQIFANLNFSLFEQAIVNLIDNAIKHSPENEKIMVELSQKGSGITIAVKDRGCGMDEKHLQHIFERFYRVDKGRSRDVGGTGLGLSIVKHVIGLHNGDISVESKVGQGSTFLIKLPQA